MFDKNGASNKKAVAIVLTDGVSTLESDFTLKEAAAAKDEGIDIFAIGNSISLLWVLESVRFCLIHCGPFH